MFWVVILLENPWLRQISDSGQNVSLEQSSLIVLDCIILPCLLHACFIALRILASFELWLVLFATICFVTDKKAVLVWMEVQNKEKKMLYKYSSLIVDAVSDWAADSETLSTYHCASLCDHGNHRKHCKEIDAKDSLGQKSQFITNWYLSPLNYTSVRGRVLEQHQL